MRAMAPMAATDVNSSMASVLARRASTPSRTELAIINAATPRRAAHESKCGPIGQKDRQDRSGQ